MRIEAARQNVIELPMTPKLQGRLRETARLQSTHYSTQIEGNRLTLEEAIGLIERDEHLPARQRDEREVLGYYRGIEELEKLVLANAPITERRIQTLHALIMGSGRGKGGATPYRDGQNVIREGRGGAIVYMPPEAKDVPGLMADLAAWLEQSESEGLPCPLRAALAHYQFATIHPYYDGNGRTARLLTTFVLYLGGYDLKGFYSLEEYYARDLQGYYRAIAVGPSHNYYVGRADADVTSWVEYFCAGMAESFESVQRRAKDEAGKKDRSQVLRRLNPRQRKALDLFQLDVAITAAHVAALFGLQPRTARELCAQWVTDGFLVVLDPSKKARKYGLSRALARELE